MVNAEEESIRAFNEFCRYMILNGKPRPTARTLKIQPPLPHATDGETDCWTHAWVYAKQHGVSYVEGVCKRKGRPGAIAAHAWCETESPFGSRMIIELTEGYENAYDYQGFELNVNHKMGDFAWYEKTRFSMVQLFIATGYSPVMAVQLAREGL